MASYFFNLRNAQGGYVDRTGVELADDDAARMYACLVAGELMKNREIQAWHWRIDVRDSEGRRLFEVAFVSHDPRVRRMHPSHQEKLEKLSERRCELAEAMDQSRAVKQQAKAVVAKARGKPYLAADEGEEVLGSL